MRIKPWISAALTAVLLAAPAAADTLVTMKVATSGALPLGQPGGEEVTRTWIGKNNFRTDRETSTVIGDLEQHRIFLIDHLSKTYQVVELPLDLKSLVPEEMQPMIEQVLDQMKVDVRIEPTEDRRVIAGHPSRLYRLKITNTMGVLTEVEQWTTSEIEVPGYKRLSQEMASLQPMAAEITKKINEIEGFPVLRETTVTMMGNQFNTREELVSVETLKAADGLYEHPADYARTPFDPMSALRAR